MNRIANLWYDQNFRHLFFQVVAVLAIAYFGYFLFDNTSTNLERLNIKPGFDFMGEIAGFMPTTDGMPVRGGHNFMFGIEYMKKNDTYYNNDNIYGNRFGNNNNNTAGGLPLDDGIDDDDDPAYTYADDEDKYGYSNMAPVPEYQYF